MSLIARPLFCCANCGSLVFLNKKSYEKCTPVFLSPAGGGIAVLDKKVLTRGMQ